MNESWIIVANPLDGNCRRVHNFYRRVSIFYRRKSTSYQGFRSNSYKNRGYLQLFIKHWGSTEPSESPTRLLLGFLILSESQTKLLVGSTNQS